MAVAVARMSAPVMASIPVCDKYYMTGPVPIEGEYMRAKISKA